MEDVPVADLPLDAMRPHLVEAMLAHVPFDGWGWKALDAAAADLGVLPAAARLAFPGGAIDMVDAYARWSDRRMTDALAAVDMAGMKVRARFETALLTRLLQAAPHREAERRAVLLLARPQHLARAARIGWRTADAIWLAMGDRSTDFSWYSRRATAAAVHAASVLVWLDDDSEDFATTRAFVERRIADVLRIEKLKASARRREHFSLPRFFGRLRYPVER